ncbi:MAG: Crp/Fnr family transcriptional regulator [Arachidicoccus sp.]|nr:Crp/Fnr family transcriptional regulator [Arachidicoccus sp.]
MSLIESINKISQVSKEVEEEILNKFKEISFPKKTIVEKQELVCDHLYYVEKGLARLFYIKDDKDITGWFASEGKFITCNDSLFQRKVSHLNLEFLEDSIAYSVHINDLNELLKFPDMERFGLLMVYNSLNELSERLYSTLFQPAEKRYQLMMVHHPTIAQRAPLGYIASYLGITQETLSRIRAQQTTKAKGSFGI